MILYYLLSLVISSEGGSVNWCRNCRRYQRPPWILCDRESKELLTICLKKIRGLDQCKVIETSFVFTEPSSKILKVKVTIEKEVMNQTSLRQTFIVEFHEEYKQCSDCKQEFTPHTWSASIQLRQRVMHKKTFYYLEQQIIKNHMNDKIQKIETVNEGMNLYFKAKKDAVHMVDFIKSILPTKIQLSKEIYSFVKYTYIIDVPRICKDDIVFIPQKLCQQLGGINFIQLCYKITSLLHFIDPLTMKCTELAADRYFLFDVDTKVYSLKSIGTEFTIMDIEKVQNKNLNESFLSSVSNQFIHNIVNVSFLKSDGDFTLYQTKSHLGNQISIGQTVLGFDLTNQTSEFISAVDKKPDYILVKLFCSIIAQVKKKTEKHKNRRFKLKRLEIEQIDEEMKSKQLEKQQQKDHEDFQDFLNDLEEDQELRKGVNLYKNTEKVGEVPKQEDEVQTIKPEELIDE